ncbi:MAG: DUF4351 domain-containing protein [Clostridiaceae bacterium]|nr:DUF4351 domain-containing protein [Clostridiaceae bacterium]
MNKKFGILPQDIRDKIEKLDAATLDIIIGEILDYKSIEDVNKYLK